MNVSLGQRERRSPTRRAASLFLLAMAASACATKYYKTPAPADIPPRGRFLDGVALNVGVFDARPGATGRDELAAEVMRVLDGAYPDAMVRRVDYFGKPEDVAVTVSVRVDFLESGFSSEVATAYARDLLSENSAFGMTSKSDWSGAAVMTVQVVDKRQEDPKTQELRIERVATKPNMWGYATAKAVLDDAWEEAAAQMCSFIDRALMG